MDDAGRVLLEFQRHDGVVRLALRDYKGAKYIDMRKWFTGVDSELHPTKQGVSLSVEVLPELQAALAQAEALLAA